MDGQHPRDITTITEITITHPLQPSVRYLCIGIIYIILFILKKVVIVVIVVIYKNLTIYRLERKDQ